jgi:hypothetical protein
MTPLQTSGAIGAIVIFIAAALLLIHSAVRGVFTEKSSVSYNKPADLVRAVRLGPRIVRLVPNFWLSSRVVCATFFVFTVLGYFTQGYSERVWWSSSYFISLTILSCIMSVALWFMVVPKRLEFSETYLAIKPPLRGNFSLPWKELRYWGYRQHKVMRIEFNNIQAFQIFRDAFPKEQWAQLIEFLSTRFPERKISG